jgi:hypothetical protein
MQASMVRAAKPDRAPRLVIIIVVRRSFCSLMRFYSPLARAKDSLRISAAPCLSAVIGAVLANITNG